MNYYSFDKLLFTSDNTFSFVCNFKNICVEEEKESFYKENKILIPIRFSG